MSFNKNGLEIKVNFDYSLKDKELENINNELTKKNIIENNITTIFFPSKPKKVIELQKYTMNFPIISIKQRKDLIINKILNFDFSGTPQNINKSSLPSVKYSKPNLQILNIDKINLASLDKEIKEESKKEITPKDIIKEGQIYQNLFSNLNIFSENIVFIQGGKIPKEIKKIEKNEIESKLNDIEIIGKQNDKKVFITLKAESKITNIEINEKIKKKFDTLEIESKINNIEINITQTKKEEELKIHKSEALEIKSIKKEINLSIESNIIKFEIIESVKKFELFIQSNIIVLEIICENKKKNYQMAKNIINFEIKSQQKKKTQEILLKKVDNFLSPNDKLHYKNKISKKIEVGKESKDTKNPKLDIYKTKSPNQIIINRATPKEININNNNYENRIYINEQNKIGNLEEENKNKNTLNNEIINNKESIQIPINNDIIHLEKQYEKIKKELNDLYPVFSKNKQYRESFFVQLSQGNQGKYNFYLDLYKIIKDEQEEKKNNNYENYLKMKKIIDGKSSGNNKKFKQKLKPLKKNSSSCSIVARNKLFPTYTEENYY